MHWCNFTWVPTIINPRTAGVLYTEQNHLHGQRREFRIWNDTQKTKEKDVKTILFSLAYSTPKRRMGFINPSSLLPDGSKLHLSRNAAKVSESLKISDQRMAKLYWAVFIHKQPLEGFPNLVMPPLALLSPLCRADFQGVASSRKMETKGK